MSQPDSINVLYKELEIWTDAHLQLTKFYSGDLVEVYNTAKVKHSSLVVDITDAGFTDLHKIVDLKVACFDQVVRPKEHTDNIAQTDVESDTLQILQDLFDTIRFSDRWRDWTEVLTDATCQKFVEETADKVSGWVMTIRLGILKQNGVCALPLVGYDYGGNTSPLCAPVQIFRNGVFFTSVQSGGIFEFTTNGGNGTVLITNTEDEEIAIVEVAPTETEPFEVPDSVATVKDQNGNTLGVFSIPATKSQDLNITINPCPIAYTLKSTSGTVILQGIINDPCANGGVLDIEVPNVRYYDCDGEIIDIPFVWPIAPVNEICPCKPTTIEFNGVPFIIADPCAGINSINCNTPLNAFSFASGTHTSGALIPTSPLGDTYETYTDGAINVYYNRGEWIVENLIGTRLFYFAVSDVQFPWLVDPGDWQITPNAEAPAPSITQLTVGTALDCCEACLTLAQYLAEIDETNVMTQVWDALNEDAQDEIKDNVCPVISLPWYSGQPYKALAALYGGATDEGLSRDTLIANNPFGNTTRLTDLVGGTTFADNVAVDWNSYDPVTSDVRVWYTVVQGAELIDTHISNAAALSVVTSVGTLTGWRAPTVEQIESIKGLNSDQGWNYTPFNLNTNTSGNGIFTITPNGGTQNVRCYLGYPGRNNYTHASTSARCIFTKRIPVALLLP
jgi:hypothetical protein